MDDLTRLQAEARVQRDSPPVKVVDISLKNNTELICDMCGKNFSHEPLPVVDENYNVQRGVVSCGCHIYTEEDGN